MAEIVVIGGGIIGASVAYHLSARGAKGVILVERGAIGSGETHKSGGFVQTHWNSIHEVRLIAWSREVFEHWRERIGRGDCGWVRGGYMHTTGAANEAEVRAIHARLVAEKLESHWLDPAALAEIQPLLNVEGLVGGTWEPASGWANPMQALRSFVDAARANGAEIREQTRVLSIDHAHDRITGVTTSAGSIPCRAVVLAAGPWTPALHAVPELALPIELERGQVCYFERPDGLPARELGFYDEVLGVYTHPDGDTNLVGKDWPFEAVADPDHYERTVDQRYTFFAKLALAFRLPALAAANVVRGYTGLYDFTPDGQPIVDTLGPEGYYVACGFSGVGFKSSPATGDALAELIVDGRSSTHDIAHLRYARFMAR